jgi:hypothetical protein
LLAANNDISMAKLEIDIQRNLRDQRRDEGLNTSLLISLPLTLKTSEILKQVKKLLLENRDEVTSSIQQPKIKLNGKRLHGSAIFKGLRLLWIKSAKPNWELWRLGTYTKFSDSYSNILNVNAPKRTENAIDAVDRQIITKITFRALNKFQLVAENAARGKFPCSDPIEISNFDYRLIAKRLADHTKWVKHEKLRLSKTKI